MELSFLCRWNFVKRLVTTLCLTKFKTLKNNFYIALLLCKQIPTTAPFFLQRIPTTNPTTPAPRLPPPGSSLERMGPLCLVSLERSGPPRLGCRASVWAVSRVVLFWWWWGSVSVVRGLDVVAPCQSLSFWLGFRFCCGDSI